MHGDVAQNLYSQPRDPVAHGPWVKADRLARQARPCGPARARSSIKSGWVARCRFRQRIRDLSGGQRQCVAIGRAVGWSRKIVFLDEPTAALGVRQTRHVLDLIARLRDQGIAVVLISHNMEQVLESLRSGSWCSVSAARSRMKPVANLDGPTLVGYVTGLRRAGGIRPCGARSRIGLCAQRAMPPKAGSAYCGRTGCAWERGIDGPDTADYRLRRRTPDSWCDAFVEHGGVADGDGRLRRARRAARPEHRRRPSPGFARPDRDREAALPVSGPGVRRTKARARSACTRIGRRASGRPGRCPACGV